ncbi:MAG TPA: hypothetical protein VF420_13365 [Casimicrobiaceae bacterium]
MPDGTLAVPRGANFANELGLGIWRSAPGLLGFAVNNGVPFLPMQVGTGTILNSDPINPSVVRFAARGYMPALVGGTSETAHFFARVDPTLADPQQAAIYIDITAAQLDTQGPAIKVIHAGAGDGIYVAMVGGNGSGYECATWVDGTRGYISTIQVDGLANSTLFNALWDQPTVPNSGMFLADRSPGNAYTVVTRTGANPGQTQIRILDQAAGRNHFAAYTDGSVQLDPDAATGGGDVASPEERVFASSWDGVAAQPNGFVRKSIPNGNPNRAIWAYYARTPLGTKLVCQLANDNAVVDGTIWIVGENGEGAVHCADVQSAIRMNLIVNAGNLAAQLDDDPNVNDSYWNWTINTAAGEAVKHVVQGQADSAGVGFRAIAVPNDAADVTAVITTDFALDANWGAGATVTSVAAGSTCRRGSVTITAAGVPAPGAVATLTFPTAFAATPFAVAQRTDANNPPEITSMSVKALSTTTTLALTLTGTSAPLAGTAYDFTWMVME